jgi:hypothetical protein
MEGWRPHECAGGDCQEHRPILRGHRALRAGDRVFSGPGSTDRSRRLQSRHRAVESGRRIRADRRERRGQTVLRGGVGDRDSNARSRRRGQAAIGSGRHSPPVGRSEPGDRPLFESGRNREGMRRQGWRVAGAVEPGIGAARIGEASRSRRALRERGAVSGFPWHNESRSVDPVESWACATGPW